MTALKPADTWDVTPLSHDEERKLLRRVILNRVCAHPECDLPTESAHHLWPQGFIKSSSWAVRVQGVEQPVLHAVGLCGTGTTGHHGDLEEHRGWVRYEDGVFSWYERQPLGKWAGNVYIQGGNVDDLEFGTGWKLVGPLSPQPGEVGQKKVRKRKQGAEKRVRKTISVAVPQDEQEDGAGVLDDLIQACREQWAEDMGWSPSVPAYFVIVAGLAKALQ